MYLIACVVLSDGGVPAGMSDHSMSDEGASDRGVLSSSWGEYMMMIKHLGLDIWR